MTTRSGTLPTLQVTDLTVRFGGLTAVNKLSFEVKPNQIFSIIGPNGAGKTTVFNAVTGVYQPTEGTVSIDGQKTAKDFGTSAISLIVFIGLLSASLVVLILNIQSIWQEAIISGYVYRMPFDWSAALKRFVTFIASLPIAYGLLPFTLSFGLAMVATYRIWSQFRRTPEYLASLGASRTFQNIRLCKQMTVLQNLLIAHPQSPKSSFWSGLFSLPNERRARHLSTQESKELLEFVGLDGKQDLYAVSLPYGHQRRLEIARAMARKPRLILLDEPAAGMNPSEAEHLMELIQRVRDRGITVVLIEHHMKVVMGISDYIVVIDYGNKIAEGTPEEVRNNPKVVEAYLGRSHSI